MTWDQIEAGWPQLSERVNATWTKLTREDLERIKGQRDQLLATIQNRYSVTKDQAEREVDLFECGLAAENNQPDA